MIHGTTHPKCQPKCSCGVQGARQGPSGSRTACAPRLSPTGSSGTLPNVPSQQPLPIYPERAPPQQMFRTQHSGSHGGTSNTNHLEKKATNYQTIPLLCCIPDPKVTGKGWRRQGAREGEECVRECSQAACSCSREMQQGSAAPWHGPGLAGHPKQLLCPVRALPHGAGGSRSREDRGEFLPLCFPSWLSPSLGGAVTLAPRWGNSFVVQQSLVSEAVAEMFWAPAGPTVPPGLQLPWSWGAVPTG